MMSKKWYLSDNNGNVVGPYGVEVLQNLVAEGRLFADAKICEFGSQEWKNAGTLKEFFPDLNRDKFELVVEDPDSHVAGMAGTQHSGMNDATTNPVGLAGLICSVLGWLTCGLLCPLGVTVSLCGLTKKPNSLAIAGIIVGAPGTVLLLTVGLGIKPKWNPILTRSTPAATASHQAKSEKSGSKRNPENNWGCLASAMADLPFSYPVRTRTLNSWTKTSCVTITPRGRAVRSLATVRFALKRTFFRRFGFAKDSCSWTGGTRACLLLLKMPIFLPER